MFSGMIFKFARQHRAVLHGRGLFGATGTIAFAARGWGKTVVSLHLAAQAALSACAADTALWLTPVADQFRAAWRTLRQAYRPQIVRAHRSEGRVSFHRAGALEFRSAFDPDHLRGKTYRAVVLDEAALIPADGWQACIRPTQRRAEDWYVLLTTPRGQDWVVALAAGQRHEENGERGTGNRENADQEKEAERNENPENGKRETMVFRFPAMYVDAAGAEKVADNLDRARVLAAKKELPEQVFAREYLCDFGVSGNGCFAAIEEHIDRDLPLTGAGPAAPGLTGPFVIGVDWGFAHDYTVACVLDAGTGRVAELYRVRRIGSQTMCAGVAALARRYRDAFCLCDVTGLQDQALSLLQAAGAWAAGFVFTPQSKTDLVEHLLVQWEQGRVRLPAHPALMAELKIFELQYTPATRQRQYGAAPGVNHHDDCVIALALAWWAVLQYPGKVGGGGGAEAPQAEIPRVDWEGFFL